MHFNRSLRKQRGSAIAYAMSAVILISLVTAAMLQSHVGQGKSIKVSKNINELSSQINLIRQQLILCATLYPDGNNGVLNSTPAFPGGTASTVSTLDCPGSPLSNKNLWTGKYGVFLPRQAPLFNDWTYTNDATGVYVQTSAKTSDIYSQKVVSQISATFSSAVVETPTSTSLKVWVLKTS